MLSNAVSVKQIQELDRIAIEQYGIPSIVLMENAGLITSLEVRRLLKDRKTKSVSIFCGPGHNGGDGFVVARHLLTAGVEVNVFLIGHSGALKPDAALNLAILKKINFPIHEIEVLNESHLAMVQKSDIVVDAIFGAGLNRAIDEPFKTIIQTLNNVAIRIVSVDVPSGLDATSGEIYGVCIRANRTVTFTFPKKGFYLNKGPEYAGKVIVRPIGIPQLLADSVLHGRLK